MKIPIDSNDYERNVALSDDEVKKYIIDTYYSIAFTKPTKKRKAAHPPKGIEPVDVDRTDDFYKVDQMVANVDQLSSKVDLLSTKNDLYCKGAYEDHIALSKQVKELNEKVNKIHDVVHKLAKIIELKY